MIYSSRESFKTQRVLSKLIAEISSLKHDFLHKRNKVDEFVFSRFHHKLMLIGARKRSISKLIMNVLSLGARTLRYGSRCPEGLKNLLRQLGAVESEFYAAYLIMNPKNPLHHVDEVIKAVEHDLELNFCSLRQICCNLPHRQNWRQFLTHLTNRDRGAAFKYYKAALKEVRLRSRCISSVDRILNLLIGEKAADQHVLTAVQRLAVSNTSCGLLCYDLWLLLINMIVFLERRIPLKTGDKSVVVALSHLRHWQKVLSKGSYEVEKAVDKSELCRRRRPEIWYSCLGDRLLFQMNRNFRRLEKSGRNAVFGNNREPLKSVDKQVVNLAQRAKTVETLEPDMSDGSQRESRLQSSIDIQNSPTPNKTEAILTSVDRMMTVRKVDDHSQSELPGLLNVSLRPRSGGLSNSSRAESREVFRTPPSILRSETRKAIAQMPAGSDIIRTSSSELIFRETILEENKSQRVDSYLEAFKTAETLVAQQHSNSNVEISASKLRKSCSDDHLLKAALARVRSLDDLSEPQTGRTISLSHSLDDTISYPFGSSEHGTCAWDNYQVPYYSIVEGIDLVEPKHKLSGNLFWEDLFPNKTEARDFEQHFLQPKVTTRQIDEWSFDGLSGTAPSSQEFDDAAHSNGNGSRSSGALLGPADNNPLSDDDQEMPLQRSVRQDKCLQTEMDGFASGILTPPTFLNISQGATPHDTNTTQTSGYESGTDIANCFFQRALTPPDGSTTVDQLGSSTSPPTRSFGVQTLRSNFRNTSTIIIEEPPESYFLDRRVDLGVVTRSERDIFKLGDFLREILVSSGSSLTSTQVSRKQKYSTCSSACTGPKSIFHLMKSFSCALELAEQNTKLLRRSGTSDSHYRDVLSNKWTIYAKWIHNHVCELRNLNNYQERTFVLLARMNVLNRVVDALPSQKGSLIKNCNSLSSQTLISEACAVAEESETIREALLKQKLQMMASTHPTSQNFPQLSDLEVLFTNCLGNILDRTINDVRSLAEQANEVKSAFIYLEALTERLQTSASASGETALNTHFDSSDRAPKSASTCLFDFDSSKLPQSGSTKGYVLDRNRCSYHWKNSSISFVTALILLVVLIVLFCIGAIIPAREQSFPFRCLSSTWPGCRAIRIYQIGVPPQ